MTKKMKIPKFKTFYIFALALYLNVGCSVENELIEQNQNSSIIHKKLNLEDLKKEKIITTELNEYSNIMNNSKSSLRTSDSYIIDVSLSNYLETEDFVSYTFSMPTTKVPLRNFLLKRNKNKTHFDGYIIEYNLTNEELLALQNQSIVDLSNKISSTHVGSNFSAVTFGMKTLNQTSNTCYGFVGLCFVGDQDGHVAYGSDCTISAYQFQAFDCPESGGGYTPPPFTSEPITNPPYNENQAGGGLVIAPIKTNSEPISSLFLFEDSECEILKNLFDPSKQNINATINALKQKILSGAKNEWGSSHQMINVYDPIENENTVTYQNSPLLEGSQSSVNVTTGTEYPGSTHSHPKTGYPIFSWQDLRLLRNTFQYCSQTYKPNVSIQIVCHNKNNPALPLVYSLRVKDFDKLNTKINQEWDKTEYNGKTEEQKIEIIHKELADKYDENKNNLELFFLQNFKDFGVELYKANETTSNWIKLELETNQSNPKGILKQTPCTN